MAHPLFWQIPPFSRNDKTLVLRGKKMWRLCRHIFYNYPIDLASPMFDVLFKFGIKVERNESIITSK